MAGTTGNIWVDAAVAVAAYALLYKKPLGYEAEAFAAYQEALAIPSRRATAIAKIQQMLSLAQQAGDAHAVQTIEGYLTALGANPAAGSPSASPAPESPSGTAPTTPSPAATTPQGASPAATFAACSQGLYEQGSTGACVMLIQRTLNQLAAQGTIHLTNAPLAVDGIFGPETASAVRQFQAQEGIPVDGIVGPQTWGKLQNPTPTGSARTPTASGHPLQTYEPVPQGAVPFLSCPYGYFHQVFYEVRSPFFQTHEGIWTACLPAVPSNLKGLPGVSLTGFNPETWLSLGPVRTVQGGGAPLPGPIYGVAQYNTDSGQLEQVYLQTNNPGAKGTLLGGGQGFVQLP
jgi:peptidoglycan hydrolase-like protein with peptidoglycan-binding domain